MVDKKLEIKDVSLNFGRKEILKGVSMDMEPGRILALIGPNGAGKSSTMRIMADLVRPGRGSAIFQGKWIDFSHIKNFTGFYIEIPSFYKYLSARQNLKILQKIRPKGKPIEELIDMVGLTNAADMLIRKFSKGMKQRLGIAQALIGKPDFLILDEPFDGLDPEVKQFLMDLVVRLAKEEDKAILISSHQLDDMEKIADDVVLISRGEVKLKGEIKQLLVQKQRVRFYFLDETLAKAMKYFSGKENVIIQTEYIETLLTYKGTEEMVKELVDFGAAPVRIEHANLLHEKYFELTK